MGYKMKRRRAVLKARDIMQKLCAERASVAPVKDELAVLKQRLADPANPARESDMVLLKSNAESWKAKATAAIEEGDRLRRLAVQNGGHIESLAVRLARAEAMLRIDKPPLTLVPPHAIAA